jgi:hypothetical protein
MLAAQLAVMAVTAIPWLTNPIFQSGDIRTERRLFDTNHVHIDLDTGSSQCTRSAMYRRLTRRESDSEMHPTQPRLPARQSG